jgi:hypothetical protein
MVLLSRDAASQFGTSVRLCEPLFRVRDDGIVYGVAP